MSNGNNFVVSESIEQDESKNTILASRLSKALEGGISSESHKLFTDPCNDAESGVKICLLIGEAIAFDPCLPMPYTTGRISIPPTYHV